MLMWINQGDKIGSMKGITYLHTIERNIISVGGFDVTVVVRGC